MTGTVISGNRRIGGAELDARAARAATGLTALGLAPGESLALVLRNDIAFAEASLAANRLGAYVVPINWHFSGEEIGYVLRDCAARVLVVHADLWPRVAADAPEDIDVLVVRTPPELAAAYSLPADACAVPAGMKDWDSWIDSFSPSTEPPRPAPATMIYTSGTTGRPKGVRRVPPTPEQVRDTMMVRSHVFDFRPDMKAVMTGPLYHSAPNLYLGFTLRVGGTLILQPRFDAEEFLAMIEAERITHAHMVPTMFVRLNRLPEAVKRRHDLSSLVRIIHGAAPCPPDVKRAIIDWWGPVVCEYYGSTEVGTVTFCTSEEWLAHPGTVGRAVPTATVKVLDEQGREVPPHIPGEVYARLWSHTDFTYQNRDADRRAIERDGLLTSGDIGYLDEDGFLYLCDRRRDMVISGGVNIYPAEIEHVLIAMPGVRDCAVFGIPDDEFGEALAAAVEPDGTVPLDQTAVRAFLSERIARYKVPKLVLFDPALPREESGKIFKRRLRDPFWEQAGRRI